MNRSKLNKDQGIAAIATALIVMAIVAILLCIGLKWDPKLMAEASTPELAPEDEELFIEPEFLDQNLDELGEEQAETNDEAAPQQLGEPEKAEVENNKVVVKGENEKPAPQKEKLVTQEKQSPVKVQESPKSKEPEQKVSSKMAGNFSSQNGKTDGKNGASGSGGQGTGVKGNLKGRKLISCPMPDTQLRNKVVVKVTLQVDENGNVVGTPTASGGGDSSIRQKCINAAKRAKWEPKKGAGTVTGTITFTITPK